MVHLKRLVKAAFLCSSEDSSKLARAFINESLLKMDPCNFRRNKPPEQSSPSLKGARDGKRVLGVPLFGILRKQNTKDGMLTGPNDIIK